MTKQIGVTELLPCPFCQGGEYRIDEQFHWTGMQNELVCVKLLHWCEAIPETPQSLFTLVRNSREEVVTAWNTRDTAQRKADFEAGREEYWKTWDEPPLPEQAFWKKKYDDFEDYIKRNGGKEE